MVAQIVSLFQRTPRFSPTPLDWGQQELAEFYRVESALIRAGISVGTDRGLSDEGEPWFIFFRADDGEVVIHFARIDGEYLIAGPAYEEIARGPDFTALVRNMIARHPLVRSPDRKDNVLIHPAALLVAIVGTAFFKTGEAKASETGKDAAPSRPALLFNSSSPVAVQAAPPQHIDSVQVPANQAVLILAAALLASDYSVEADTIDASARNAIQATAATLDFGGFRQASASSHLDLAAGSVVVHGSMTDASAAQHIASVLSLVAVLSSMPQAENAMDNALAPTGSQWFAPTHNDTLSNAPLLSANDGNWAIDVRLTSGSLPSVEAVALVRGAYGEAGYKKISIIEVSKLPEILTDLISRGEHIPTSAAPQGPIALPDTLVPTTPLPSTPDVGQDGDGPGAGPVIEPSKPVAPIYSSPDLVKQFINYFIDHTDHVEVMAQGSTVIMFDTRVLHSAYQIEHLSSLTFDFADGSSISLVGAHAAFLNTDFLT